MLAIETHHPERYLWIDEAGIVDRIGSHATDGGDPRVHGLWIPPSTGWSSLHPRAQRLVADVLVLQNLADRGSTPTERDEHLHRADRYEVPPCLSGHRDRLDPKRTLSSAVVSEPGWNCLDHCRFRLCPHPPKGLSSVAVELPEAFCRRQRMLAQARGPLARRHALATWQGRRAAADVATFWQQMEARARR